MFLKLFYFPYTRNSRGKIKIIFNSRHEILFTIGPQLIEYLLRTHIYKYIKYVFEICYLMLFGAHMYTSLVNPGICLLEKNKDEKGFILCEQQMCLINPQKEFEHCPECDICCEGLDHHCEWIGKCIGKNNLISFYIFVVMIPVFVIVAIIAVFSAMVELN